MSPLVILGGMAVVGAAGYGVFHSMQQEQQHNQKTSSNRDLNSGGINWNAVATGGTAIINGAVKLAGDSGLLGSAGESGGSFAGTEIFPETGDTTFFPDDPGFAVDTAETVVEDTATDF